MSLFHEGWRERTSLLAAGALDGAERARAEAHVAACAACARDLEGLRGALSAAAFDPARQAEPPLALSALVARVMDQLDEPARAAGRPRWALAGLAAAAAALAVAVLWGPAAMAPPSERPGAPVAEQGVPEDVMARLEHTMARERAARYLADAGDVLVGVASNPRLCARRDHRVDLGAEAERSRKLLERRALLVEMDAPAVASARDVLVDVEGVLREVAALDPCADARELEEIRAEISRSRLLMKIDLVTRELSG